MGIPLEFTEAIQERDQLMRLIKGKLLYPVYQPIIDVYRNNVVGYEVLTRGVPPMESPSMFLGAAGKYDLSWEIEHECRMSFMDGLTANRDFQSNRYFVNVSPAVFVDKRFHKSFSAKMVKSFGLRPEQIVMEITERDPITDYGILKEASKYFKSQGFGIALDDLGSGHSGLCTLVECIPDHLKLDMSLVHGIAEDAYKQQMVHFLCKFAPHVHSRIIAEGVETWAELVTLLRLGVRFFQGFLFGIPERQPTMPCHAVMEKLRMAWNEFNHGDNDKLEGLASLIIRGFTIEKDSVLCEDLHELAKRGVFHDHLIILDDGKPFGLITTQNFFLHTGGAFGYSLFQKKKVDEICKRNFLSVRYDSSVRTLSKLAMERENANIYDPVVVVDASGFFMGTVTMKQLISRASELEVDRAMNSNPLSGLPGNRYIESWISGYQQNGQPFTLIYADLDNFKQYNDRYGFLSGDKLIKMTADLLVKSVDKLPQASTVGHIGGDDFVCVCPGSVSPDILSCICTDFDDMKKGLFSGEDVERGYYEGKERDGKIVNIPLVTLSLAVLESDRLDPDMHPAMIAEIAAGLKAKVKDNASRDGRSSFLCERRSYVN